MKTSVIGVHDMLSVLSVAGVEKRISEVPGVESVTVNFEAETATVRYDETRLQATDIKAAVHHSANESAGESPPKAVNEHKPAGKPAALPTPEVTVPKASTVAPAITGHEDHAAQGTKPSMPEPAVPKPTAPSPAAVPKTVPVASPAIPEMGGHQDHAASVAKPSTPVTASPKTAAAAPAPATRAIEAAPVVKSSTPDIIDPNAGSWKVNALSLATTLGAAYISCAIFDLLFPPFGLLAVLAPASPLPISGSPLGFLLGFAMFIVAGLVLGALHGFATQFWHNRLR